MSQKKARTKRTRNTAEKFPAPRAASSSGPEMRPGAPFPIARPAAVIVREADRSWRHFVNVSALRYACYNPARIVSHDNEGRYHPNGITERASLYIYFDAREGGDNEDDGRAFFGDTATRLWAALDLFSLTAAADKSEPEPITLPDDQPDSPDGGDQDRHMIETLEASASRLRSEAVHLAARAYEKETRAAELRRLNFLEYADTDADADVDPITPDDLDHDEEDEAAAALCAPGRALEVEP